MWMAVGGAPLLSLQGGKGVLGNALEALWWLGGMALIVSCVGSVITVFVRLQTAEGIERQQIKWFAYGAALLLGSFASSSAVGQVGGQWAVFALIVTGLLGIPVTVGIAILKYRLYDIDQIINRTLVYGALRLLGAGLLRRRDGHPDHPPSVHRPGEASATRHSGLHPGHRRAVQPAEETYPVFHR